MKKIIVAAALLMVFARPVLADNGIDCAWISSRLNLCPAPIGKLPANAYRSASCANAIQWAKKANCFGSYSDLAGKSPKKPLKPILKDKNTTLNLN
jgi:hypothetical protein